jgi:hypothetical protein
MRESWLICGIDGNRRIIWKLRLLTSEHGLFLVPPPEI